MKRLAALSLAALIVLLALPAMAQTFTVSFDAERREWHGPVPAYVQVGTVAIPDAYHGQTCDVTFRSVNNTSEHNTDLVVESAGDSLDFFDIEQGTDLVATGQLAVGESVVVSLRLNEHNARGFAVSSLGGTVTIDCEEPPSDTTTTSTTSPETTIPSSTTTPTGDTSTTVTTPPPDTTPAPTSTAPSPQPTIYPDPTDPPPVVQSSVPSGETLPETGVDSDHLAVVALVALVSGAGLVALTRRAADG